MKFRLMLPILALFLASVSYGKDIKIASDTSGLSPNLVNSVAAVAVGAGVQEPLKISSTQEGAQKFAIVEGASSAHCKIALSSDAEPKIKTVSCKK